MITRKNFGMYSLLDHPTLNFPSFRIVGFSASRKSVSSKFCCSKFYVLTLCEILQDTAAKKSLFKNVTDNFGNQNMNNAFNGRILTVQYIKKEFLLNSSVLHR